MSYLPEQPQKNSTDFKSFISSLSFSKALNIISLIILVLAIPITVYVAQQQQEVRQRAQTPPVTTPSPYFTPTPSVFFPQTANIEIFPPYKTLTLGEEYTFLINLDPGTHHISFVKLKIDFDPYDLTLASAGLVINEAAFPTTFTKSYGRGTVAAELGIGQNPSAVFRGGTFATLTLKAIGEHGPKQTLLKFDSVNNNTQALSVSPGDPPNHNVIGSFKNTAINIIGPITPTPDPCTPCSADVNRNGKVTQKDYKNVVKCYNQPFTNKNKCSLTDIDKNGKADVNDANCVIRQMNLRCTTRAQKAEPAE